MKKLVAACLMAGLGGCEGGGDGTLRVTARAEGGDLDENGYEIVVDGEHRHLLHTHGRIQVDLEAGAHQIELAGLEPNCGVVGDRIVRVSVTEGLKTDVEFAILCEATGIRVVTSVEGIDLDPWLHIRLDDEPSQGWVASNTAQEVTRLAPGTYDVSLSDVNPNCRFEPRSHTVVVTPRRVTPVQFSGFCVAATAVIVVRIQATGDDVDLSGYGVTLDESWRAREGASQVTLTEVTPGEHSIRLSGLAPNCRVQDSTQKLVLVTAGRPVRDTVIVDFGVTCVRAWELAFVRDGLLTLATADGSVMDQLPWRGMSPTWTADGAWLAWDCTGICLVNLGNGSTQTLGVSLWSRGFALHPDGQQIAYAEGFCDNNWGYYCEYSGVQVITRDGRSARRLPLPEHVVSASSLRWSPDGLRIAFQCTLQEGSRLPIRKICVVAPDGTGLRRLSAGPGEDLVPDWSPDGSRIAFATIRGGTYQVAIVPVDEAGSEELIPGAIGLHPVWTPDGSRIVYTSYDEDRPGLILVTTDGSVSIQLTSRPSDGAATWRPGVHRPESQ